MYWTEILTALALVFVLEGMLPFISPAKYRQMVAEITRLSDNNIRNIGLVVMIAGSVAAVLRARLVRYRETTDKRENHGQECSCHWHPVG